jgi:hypothetical protein
MHAREMRFAGLDDDVLPCIDSPDRYCSVSAWAPKLSLGFMANGRQFDSDIWGNQVGPASGKHNFVGKLTVDSRRWSAPHAKKQGNPIAAAINHLGIFGY